MNKKEVKRFTVDDVYVSVLKADIIKHKNGWIHVREKEKMFKPTGSVLMDIVGQVLLEYNSLSAKGLAESVGADVAALAGTFRWLTGMTLHEFLIQYRMKQVCEWLTCTDITIKEIARRCGFSSQASLAHLFAQKFACSPTQYRKQHRPKNYAELYKWE